MGEDVRLLKTEKNGVLLLVQQFGLDPLGFAWSTAVFDDGNQYGASYCTSSILSHASLGFFYKFGMYTDEYSPGHRDRVETADLSVGNKWEKRVEALRTWLAALKEDVETPDSWAALRDRALDRLENAERANSALTQAENHTAASELREAYIDLSRQPPDLTGAVQHSLAALECVAREHCSDHATFGRLLQRYDDLFPKPLDKGIEKLWGFASEMGRHLREGRTPSAVEAELLVGLATACCTYIAKKLRPVA